MQKYVTLNKHIGETPLACVEKWRATQSPAYKQVSLAYAGRLDPMASGKLLVLIGDECKNQTAYHGLDKAYDFSVLFGVESDTHDVLGRLNTCNLNTVSKTAQHEPPSQHTLGEHLGLVAESMVGNITLPYPHFSSKTVRGKPLHTWTLEGRVAEITVPTKESVIYDLQLTDITSIHRHDLATEALQKINTIPEVTDTNKALGNDFRRTDVRADWERIKNDSTLPDEYHIASFHCIASSGTYMRSLASVIGKTLHTCGLAWHIHRTHIGEYDPERACWVNVFS